MLDDTSALDSTELRSTILTALPPKEHTSRAYFPQSCARHARQFRARPLPPRPDIVSPIFDLEHAQHPLSEYDLSTHNQNYLQSSEGITMVPRQPEKFSDPYLFPSLTQDERLRLTILWYYTRHLEKDEDFLSKIDRVTTTVQDAIGWDFAIVGLLDEAVYNCLAAAEFSVVLLPRRESLCSHTINQPFGSVFMSTDLANDWRFREAPHVKIGGFRSYAGTQLLLVTDDGARIALGSLCVASKSNQEPLSAKQQALLIYYADSISWEITERTRNLRSKQRVAMTEVLLKLQSQTDKADFDVSIINAVQEQYPDAHVTIQNSDTAMLELSGRPAISFSELDGNLWEDTSLIESAIRTSNYKRLTMTQPVRLVAAQCGRSSRYLVATFTEVHHVLDDLDAWFIEQCAALGAEARQNQLLTQAMDAKEAFLRNITHQLRTPIHGILGSVDLLAEEIETTKVSGLSNEPPNESSKGSSLHTLSSAYITAIRSSGRELMTTVNNILRFNTLTTAQPRVDRFTPTSYDLRMLGPEMISDVLHIVPEERLSVVSIRTVHNLSSDQSIALLSGRWLKECIEPLLLNSLQSVIGSRCGLVSMSISYDDHSRALCFDFKDTGVGINKADQGRIFAAFERVDSYKSGLGLGLTLSRGIAERHNGSISLVASLEGYGSHFRARFADQSVTSSPGSSPDIVRLPHILPCYHKFHCGLEHSYMLHHMSDRLEEYGFRSCDQTEASLIITDMRADVKEFVRLCADQQNRTIITSFTPNFLGQRIQRLNQHVTVLVVNGPFYNERLDGIFRQIDMLYAELVEPLLAKSPNENATESPCCVSTPSKVHPIVRHPGPQISQPLRPAYPTKALLVDDNIINLRILEMFCRKRKIPYVLAYDGSKAEEEFCKAAETPDPIDLVFMDLQMPICNGTDATYAIRRFEEKCKMPRSTVLIITGQDSPNDKLQSEQAGADEFLVKPVSLKVLDEHIMKHFSGYVNK